MRRSASILVPLTAVLLLLPDGARSSTVTIFGNINWTDSAGGTHPIRFADVNLFDVDGGGDQLLLLSSSDGSGGYSLTVPNLEEDLTGQDPFVEIRAVNPAGMVSTDSTIANIHEFESALIAADIPDGAHQADYIVPNTTTAGHAFSVSEAIYTGYRYAEIVRGVAPTGVSVRFTAGGSFYCASGNETGCNGVAQELNLVAGDRWDWDVILHEYGHHLSAQDGLDDSPGGSHAFGTSNIPSKGKDAGTRLAWGEGLANYISLAAQAVTAASGDLPAVPNTGGTVYQDTIDQTLSVNIETHAGSGNDGEGDETSVMRILWDIADPANEAHDLLAIGHDDLYQILGEDIASLDRLEDVWDHFFANPDDLELGAGTEDDEARAILGAIFEEYAVSPDPIAGVDGVFSVDDVAPTFTWSRENDDANDSFKIYIFNEDYSERIFATGIAVAGDVTSYTLSAAEWDILKNSGLGEYLFVVAGSDTTTYTSGEYWSGGKSFELVPEPGLSALLAFALARAAWRRRGGPGTATL